jgi:N6-adenosine-specific RNA methylase IME4
MSRDLIVSRLSSALALLAQARNATDAKQVADLARAAEVYARRQKLSQEAIDFAVTIKVDALTLMGDFLKAGPKNTGTAGQGRPRKGSTIRELPKNGAATQEQLLGKGGRKMAMLAQMLADLKEEEPALHEQVRAGRVSPAGAARQARKRKAAAAIAAEPPPLPKGPFRVIVVDPPWAYKARADDPTHRSANPYPSMTVEQIKAIDVGGLATKDCVLWLWTTNAFLPEAFGVAAAWGFRYVTLLTWVKPRMGTGDWLRGRTEHCLFCVRGKPIVLLTNQTTALQARSGRHSQKPAEFYTMVEKLCPGSKAELFARARRPGWTSWGNEV